MTELCACKRVLTTSPAQAGGRDSVDFTGLQMSLFAPHLFIPFRSLFKLEKTQSGEHDPQGASGFSSTPTAWSEFAYGECFSYITLEFGNSPDI